MLTMVSPTRKDSSTGLSSKPLTFQSSHLLKLMALALACGIAGLGGIGSNNPPGSLFATIREAIEKHIKGEEKLEHHEDGDQTMEVPVTPIATAEGSKEHNVAKGNPPTDKAIVLQTQKKSAHQQPTSTTIPTNHAKKKSSPPPKENITIVYLPNEDKAPSFKRRVYGSIGVAVCLATIFWLIQPKGISDQDTPEAQASHTPPPTELSQQYTPPPPPAPPVAQDALPSRALEPQKVVKGHRSSDDAGYPHKRRNSIDLEQIEEDPTFKYTTAAATPPVHPAWLQDFIERELKPTIREEVEQNIPPAENPQAIDIDSRVQARTQQYLASQEGRAWVADARKKRIQKARGIPLDVFESAITREQKIIPIMGPSQQITSHGHTHSLLSPSMHATTYPKKATSSKPEPKEAKKEPTQESSKLQHFLEEIAQDKVRATRLATLHEEFHESIKRDRTKVRRDIEKRKPDLEEQRRQKLAEEQRLLAKREALSDKDPQKQRKGDHKKKREERDTHDPTTSIRRALLWRREAIGRTPEEEATEAQILAKASSESGDEEKESSQEQDLTLQRPLLHRYWGQRIIPDDDLQEQVTTWVQNMETLARTAQDQADQILTALEREKMKRQRALAKAQKAEARKEKLRGLISSSEERLAKLTADSERQLAELTAELATVSTGVGFLDSVLDLFHSPPSLALVGPEARNLALSKALYIAEQDRSERAQEVAEAIVDSTKEGATPVNRDIANTIASYLTLPEGDGLLFAIPGDSDPEDEEATIREYASQIVEDTFEREMHRTGMTGATPSKASISAALRKKAEDALLEKYPPSAMTDKDGDGDGSSKTTAPGATRAALLEEEKRMAELERLGMWDTLHAWQQDAGAMLELIQGRDFQEMLAEKIRQQMASTGSLIWEHKEEIIAALLESPLLYGLSDEKRAIVKQSVKAMLSISKAHQAYKKMQDRDYRGATLSATAAGSYAIASFKEDAWRRLDREVASIASIASIASTEEEEEEEEGMATHAPTKHISDDAGSMKTAATESQSSIIPSRATRRRDALAAFRAGASMMTPYDRSTHFPYKD